MKSDLLRSWTTHLVLLIWSSPIAYSKEVPRKASCSVEGFKSCHPVKEGMLNVHLVPHSHDEVGWLKTVDQYYYGSKQEIQRAGVQYILDSVINELSANPDRRFVQVETYYLWQWFREQKLKKQQQVRQLARCGILAIANGGITSSDEATTYYQCLIDQMTWGFRRIQDMFGAEVVPVAAWNVDSFGHSNEMGSILAQMGFNGVFFARIDFQDKYKRMREKSAELVWETSASLGTSSRIFTSLLYNHYSPPEGFCFDTLCKDEPIDDDPYSKDYNVDTKVDSFIKLARSVAKHYRTNNIIVPMGGDFHYQYAHMNFKNMDKLIWYVNKRQENGSLINLLYSTPSCYLKAVNDAGVIWPLKYDDFLPHSSDDHAYWTGFYTSRPNLKYFERLGNNYLQVCKQLFVLAALDRKNLTYLDELRDAVAIMQHHDAITGTGRQHVANDYARILHKAIIGGENIANHALRELMHKNKSDSSHHPGSFQSCLLLNISECAIPEKSKNFSVTVYNPLSYTISHYVRLPVMTGVSYSVRDPAGRHLPVQLVPIPSPLINLPGRKSKATMEMVFKATDVPPLGYKSYFVERTTRKKNKEVDPWDDGMHFRIGNQVDGRQVYKYPEMTFDDRVLEKKSSKEEELNVTSESHKLLLDLNLQIIFNESTGLIQEVKKNGTHIPFQQNFLFYNSSSAEKNSSDDHSSGAYIFRPREQFATPVTKHKIMGMKTYKGELVEEVHQIFTDWISQVVRVYKDDNNFELEWLVGPLPIDDQIGKEVISRFSTNFESNGTFYTDSNGREMVKRIRNYHPYWDLEIDEPISANYYPVTTKIVIHDNKTNHHLAVFTDRSQGGTSLKDGELELMIHRRTLHDDGFGLDEALNETQYGKGLIARGKHYVVFAAGDQPQVTSLEKEIAQRRGMSPLLFLSKASCMSFEKWARLHHTEFSGMKGSLPKNIKILTLEPWRSNTILLRLEHTFEKGEDAQLSKSVTIDFHDLFVNLPYSEVTEMLLGANQEQKSKKLQWKTEKRLQNETDHQITESSPYFITLQPMQIRTFIIKLKTGSFSSKMQSFKIS